MDSEGVACLNRVLKNLSIYLLIVLVITFFVKYYNSFDTAKPDIIDYGQFIESLEKGEISSIVVQPGDKTLSITGKKKNGNSFETLGREQDPRLETLVEEKGVSYKVVPPAKPNWLLSLITSMLPILLLVLLFFFLMQQTQGGGNRVMSFGKSKAKMCIRDRINKFLLC